MKRHFLWYLAVAVSIILPVRIIDHGISAAIAEGHTLLIEQGWLQGNPDRKPESHPGLITSAFVLAATAFYTDKRRKKAVTPTEPSN